MTNGEAPRRFQFSPQRERSGALRLLAARRHAKAAGVAPSCQQGATSNMWNLHRAGGCGAYENVGGEQFYSTFESAHFRLPPTFRSRDFGQGREAIIGAQPCRLAGTWNDRPAQLIGAAARFVDAAAPIYWAV